MLKFFLEYYLNTFRGEVFCRITNNFFSYQVTFILLKLVILEEVVFECVFSIDFQFHNTLLFLHYFFLIFTYVEYEVTCGDHGSFTCSNGFCIDVECVCDGMTDCPDRSDEVGCGK